MDRDTTIDRPTPPPPHPHPHPVPPNHTHENHDKNIRWHIYSASMLNATTTSATQVCWLSMTTATECGRMTRHPAAAAAPSAPDASQAATACLAIPDKLGSSFFLCTHKVFLRLNASFSFVVGWVVGQGGVGWGGGSITFAGDVPWPINKALGIGSTSRGVAHARSRVISSLHVGGRAPRRPETLPPRRRFFPAAGEGGFQFFFRRRRGAGEASGGGGAGL